ncbi:hypothetical protein HPB52_002686 [Rhipicephalus sanguineus]|uniref:Uncharacterized protein n=1 Tax=Rhipicephalus sanguineus TaxID=34632 RepID=A0A9D4T8I3_RHISA|nr:hypothetical protein HPB52_002686 [Rhipicephalus sanguineus]
MPWLQVSNAGGGPPSEPMDEKLSQIEAAVPHLSERVNNPYDSDRQLPSPPGDRVDDIITRMTQNNAEDSDDDRTIELSGTDWHTDTVNPTSPLPAGLTEGSSESTQATTNSQQRTSQQTRGTTTETGHETVASRRALLQQTLSTELDSRLQVLQEERLQRLAEHNVRMKMMEEEHNWKRLQYADEEKKRRSQHRMKLRVLKAKLKVFSMRVDVLAKQLAGHEVE